MCVCVVRVVGCNGVGRLTVYARVSVNVSAAAADAVSAAASAACKHKRTHVRR